MLKIVVVGAGYVGLVSAACLAELGHDLTCVDINEAKINALRENRIPIYEPGLDELVSRNVQRGTLRFSTDLASTVKGCDAVFIAVGTPSQEGTDHADVHYVIAAAEEIAANLDRFTVIVVKSTVPVGTNRQVKRAVERRLPRGLHTAIVSNPEFLREGAAIADFMHPDRIVVGAENEEACQIMRHIYAPIAQKGVELLVTDLETAELIKYAANAFLAVKISYINEVADLCEMVGADAERVATGIGLDTRIGRQFLKVGPGWGGSCFPKDTRALKATAAEHVVPMKIVEAAIEANSQRKQTVINKVEAACGASVAGKRVAVLGLTFKSGTDDVRESPSIEVIRALLERGAKVRAYDPSHPAEAVRLLPSLIMAPTLVATVRSADALVVLTEWQEFADCDLSELAAYMTDPIMVDLRNLFNEATVRSQGFRHYVCLGRKVGEALNTSWKAVARQRRAKPWASKECTPAVTPAVAECMPSVEQRQTAEYER